MESRYYEKRIFRLRTALKEISHSHLSPLTSSNVARSALDEDERMIDEYRIGDD
jgi:hypothetical protein